MWSESNSDTFIEYGRYFVPRREEQIEAICTLIPPSETPFTVWELGCGEGVLAEAILTRFPSATVVGWDGSAAMRTRAGERLSRFGAHFRSAHFDLHQSAWRQSEVPLRAVVSSLVIHHLDGAGKATLYRDMYNVLESGGVLAIADIMQPTTAAGVEIAADAWDDAVAQRALQIDGNGRAYDYFRAEKWNYYRFPDAMDTPSTLFDNLKWLEAAGFNYVDAHWLYAGHAVYGGQK